MAGPSQTQLDMQAVMEQLKKTLQDRNIQQDQNNLQTQQNQLNQQNQQSQQQRNLQTQQMNQQQANQQEEQVYQQFVNRLTGLPQGVPVAQQPVQGENIGRKERRKREKQILKEYNDAQQDLRLMTASEIKQLTIFRDPAAFKLWSERKTKHSGRLMSDALRMAAGGDFSDYENLDGMFRNLFAKRELEKLNRDYNITPQSDPQAVCQQIRTSTQGVSGLLNPALRLGLSLAQRDQHIPAGLKTFYRELDEAMSTAVMEETLLHVPSEQEVMQGIAQKQPKLSQEKQRKKAHAMMEANAAQQIQIAKRLLLMQLSDFKKVDGATVSAWDKTMAVALSHCSRVVVTMPSVEQRVGNSKADHKRMWERIFYQTGTNNNLAQDKSRTSSTHKVACREVARGHGFSDETKAKLNMRGQRGMNCAIGGLGNVGVHGQVISNDGSCGHFYSMYKEAGEKHFGAILMGLESDAYGVTNHLGHTHDIKATGEKASSLGGQRTDEIGEKYGGRQCDLSQMTATEIGEWMQLAEDAIRRWQAAPGGLAGSSDASAAMKMLAGKKLDAQGLQRLHALFTAGSAAPAN